jgi:hypothetical protein
MRRSLALAAAVGLIAAGFGCQHIAGVCDCGHHPDNAVLPPATNPYTTIGAPITGVPVPETMPVPAEKKMTPPVDSKLMEKATTPPPSTGK